MTRLDHERMAPALLGPVVMKAEDREVPTSPSVEKCTGDASPARGLRGAPLLPACEIAVLRALASRGATPSGSRLS
jgi:hypothetical protein